MCRLTIILLILGAVAAPSAADTLLPALAPEGLSVGSARLGGLPAPGDSPGFHPFSSRMTVPAVGGPASLSRGEKWAAYAVGLSLLLAADRSAQRVLKDVGSRPSLSRASQSAGFLGTHSVYLGVPALLYVAGGAPGRESAKNVADALVTAGVITQVLKAGTGRMRPDESGGVGDFRGPSLRYESFPSGHTSAAFAMAAVLAEEYPKQRVAFYALATAVAASRVLLNRHFTSDIVVGAGIGIYAGRRAERGGPNILGFRF